MSAAALPALIQRFFTDRLCVQMEASRHTVAGYRDTFRLLLRICERSTRQAAGQAHGRGYRRRSGRRLPRPHRDGAGQQRAQPQHPARRDPVVLPLRRDERSNLAAALPAHPRDAQQALCEAHGDVPRLPTRSRRCWRLRIARHGRGGAIMRCCCLRSRPACGRPNWSASGAAMSCWAPARTSAAWVRVGRSAPPRFAARQPSCWRRGSATIRMRAGRCSRRSGANG